MTEPHCEWKIRLKLGNEKSKKDTQRKRHKSYQKEDANARDSSSMGYRLSPPWMLRKDSAK